MTNHTPGPWVSQPYSESLIEILGNAGLVATIGAHSNEAEANAALISAAPELLAALKAFAGVEGFKNWHDKYHPAIEAAQAAIAKAEGRA